MILQGRDHGNYCGPGRPAVYRREVRERALAMVREGVPKKDVARRLGVSYSAVKDWCRREGVKGAEAEPDMLHEFPAWVKCRMAALRWTQQELSRRSGVPSSAICNILVGKYGASLAVAVKIMDALIPCDSKAKRDPIGAILEHSASIGMGVDV